MSELVVTALLVVLTGLGTGLALFGFELATPLLRWAGSLLGAFAGGVAGFVFAPRVVGEFSLTSRLGVGVGSLLIGALVAYYLIPFVGRVAAAAAGFVMSAAAGVVLFAGDGIVSTVLTAVPADPSANPVRTIEAVESTPVLETAIAQQDLAVAVTLGVIGAGAAFKFYTDIVAIAATALGAGLLGIVGPVWIEVFRSGAATGVGLSQFSVLWFAAALVGGGSFQLVRHFEELDPRSGDFVLGD